MRIVVTGATGFLGGHLCAALRAKGHDVTGLGRHTRIGAFMTDVDVVVHLAAQTEVGRAMRDPVETFEGNIRGTWEILETCRTSKKQPRVIIASSDKAYGDNETPYVEMQDVRAGSPYETSKACADLLAQCYLSSYVMSVAITRCGNLYGPGRINWTTLIPGTIKSILEGEQPVIRSDGKFIRDYLFIDDAVRAYIRLIEGYEMGTFNFGTGVGSSVLEVVEKICELMDWKGGYEIQNKAGAEIYRQVLQTFYADKILGWRSEVSLEEGLRKCIHWYTDYFKRGS